jgi:ABC-type lipoprotein export system ATPase subunit
LIRGLFYTHPGEARSLLANLDLRLDEGEMIALSGPSGAGKTTLLNLIAGLLRPTRGSVTVLDRELSAMLPGPRARWRGRAVGYAYQDARLLPQLDVVTNVAWPLLFGDHSRREALNHAWGLLERLGLAPLGRHRPTTLSGGEERRVALARALVAHPPLLLVDEPTANLDADSAAGVLDLLSQARREFDVTTLLVSHSPEAQTRAGRRLALREGSLQEEGAL